MSPRSTELLHHLCYSLDLASVCFIGLKSGGFGRQAAIEALLGCHSDERPPDGLGSRQTDGLELRQGPKGLWVEANRYRF